MTRKILTPVFVLVFVVVLAAPVGAQTYVPPTNVTSSNPSPGPGDTVTFSGACEPGDTVTVSLDGAVLGSAACTDGVFSIAVTMPSNLAPGSHTLVVAGAGGVASTTSFTIGGVSSAPPTGPTGGTLPRTGGDPFPTAQLALGLIALGGGLVLFARKRQAASTTIAG